VRPSERRRLTLVEVTGNASAEEIAAIGKSLEHVVGEERNARGASLWLRAGRAQGRRLGNLDYRDRFSPEDAWRLSARFSFGGREYQGLHGRGDAK
jgi:hypothetical protein